eukprot:3906956-Karenia_brevis.AAC.1
METLMKQLLPQQVSGADESKLVAPRIEGMLQKAKVIASNLVSTEKRAFLTSANIFLKKRAPTKADLEQLLMAKRRIDHTGGQVQISTPEHVRFIVHVARLYYFDSLKKPSEMEEKDLAWTYDICNIDLCIKSDDAAADDDDG